MGNEPISQSKTTPLSVNPIISEPIPAKATTGRACFPWLSGGIVPSREPFCDVSAYNSSVRLIVELQEEVATAHP